MKLRIQVLGKDRSSPILGIIGSGKDNGIISDTITSMLRLIKFAAITVISGALIGFGMVWWLHVHQSASVAATRPGIAVLDGPDSTPSMITIPSDTTEPSSGPDSPGLSVVSGTTQGAVLGSTNGGISSGTSGSTPTPSTNSLPGPSGFGVYEQYKDSSKAMYGDIQVGNGKAVAQGSVATVQYRGWLTDGTKFDDSYSRGAPFTFTEGAGTVILGWAQGIYGMKEGGQRRLIIPPGQGYGSSVHGTIPANSVLVFDITLLAVK